MSRLNVYLQPVISLHCFDLLGCLSPTTAKAVKICLQVSLRPTGWTGDNIYKEQKGFKTKEYSLHS